MDICARYPYLKPFFEKKKIMTQIIMRDQFYNPNILLRLGPQLNKKKDVV